MELESDSGPFCLHNVDLWVTASTEAHSFQGLKNTEGKIGFVHAVLEGLQFWIQVALCPSLEVTDLSCSLLRKPKDTARRFW